MSLKNTLQNSVKDVGSLIGAVAKSVVEPPTEKTVPIDNLVDYTQPININAMRDNYKNYQGHPWTKMYDDIVPMSQLKSPEIQNAKFYADNFGLDTSVANLQKKFDALTKQEYEQKNAEYRASEDAYYQNVAEQNAAYQAAARKAISQALATGSSRGMQFANQFAAQNELAEQNSTGALDIATQRNKLKAQEAEAYTQNAIKADDTIRQQNLNILQQAVADRANEVQRFAADASLEAQNNLSRVQNYQFNMEQALTQYLTEQGYAIDDISSLRDFLANMYNSDKNYESDLVTTYISTLANMYNTDKNLEGTKYSVDNPKGYGGGSGGSGGSGYSNNSTLADYTDILAAYVKASPAVKKMMEGQYKDLNLKDAASVQATNALGLKIGPVQMKQYLGLD